MKKINNLEGQTFGKLTVLRLSDDYLKGQARWLCQCECGNATVVFASNLGRGHTTSCGCHKKSNYKTMNLAHGATAGKLGKKNEYPSTYKIWCLMRQRCLNRRSKAYRWYGARGIAICDRWDDYANFVLDMGHRPDGHSLDRIDNGGPYSPENCRWATRTEQARNKRNNHLLTYNGETRSIAEWAEHIGVHPNRLASRMRRGWDVERALTYPYLRTRSRGVDISHKQ